MNPEILANTDRTSWTRIAMTARYYMPRVSWQFWAFPLVSLLNFAVTRMTLESDHRWVYVQLCSMLMTLLIVWAPLSLTSRGSDKADVALPALGIEKSIVLLGYFLIIVPTLMLLPEKLLCMVAGDPREFIAFLHYEFPYVTDMDGLTLSTVVMSMTMIGSCAVSCLWSVVSGRKAAWSVFVPILVLCAEIMLTGLIFGSIGFYEGYQAAVSGNASELNTYGLLGTVTVPAISTIGVITGIYLIFALVKCCKTIGRRQV